VSERTGELGCWIIANQSLGQLSKSEIFGTWMLTRRERRQSGRKEQVPPHSDSQQRFYSRSLSSGFSCKTALSSEL
jgi:hypothetical protein